ncbi:hypothetical protein KFE25_004844 [Diacronema lutheri]|uniref:Uncharacterized protein n=1 Tax=Diacronema lutheri TaxID=2081491 RepID=A0A8J5XFX5_DIALT|nr:hypothetical protein KFE25_004844 [Diacronema lutheri]
MCLWREFGRRCLRTYACEPAGMDGRALLRAARLLSSAHGISPWRESDRLCLRTTTREPDGMDDSAFLRGDRRVSSNQCCSSECW